MDVKIIDKGTNIVIWSPILFMVYAQMAVLTLRYTDTNNKRDSRQD